MVQINNAGLFGGGDPCSAIPITSWRVKCQQSLGTGGSSGSGGSGSSGGSSGGTSLWDLITNPVALEGGIRHLFIRTSEVLIGGILVIVGLNALIKAQTNVNVVGSTTSVAKKAVKAAVKT